MSVVEKKYLKVLNASAGSGKTYNLVKEYIKILLAERENPGKFGQILAMTFTNMAALEMKHRIISGLNALADAEKEDNSKGLLDKLHEETAISREEIIKSSKAILKNLLHNYEQFSVMTIDKFNLRLIRSFAKELNLPIDFKVELDHKDYVNKVIELMLSKLGEKGYENLTQTVLAFAQERLADDERWNFQGDLEKLADQLQKENYQAFFEIILAQNYDRKEKQALKEIVKNIQEEFLRLAKVVNEKTNLPPEAYPGKSKFTDGIKKLLFGIDPYIAAPPKTLINNHNNPNLSSDLQLALAELIQFVENHADQYAFTNKYVNGFSQLALIKNLIAEINKFKDFEKIIQISEFNKMISALIQQESSPFIYEKLGTKYHHFLLDEFQDTSKMQWLNMLPLLHESAANGNFNLIVGDPKQSIYRFRNSDPKQFVDLLKSYDEVEGKSSSHKDFPLNDLGKNEDLKDNWRSADDIVLFNNELFEEMKLRLPEEYGAFYHSTSQNSQSKRKGLVDIAFAEQKREEFEEFQKARILEIVDSCTKDGYKKSDICFLFEKNKIAIEWSNFLIDNGHEIVSAESLLIINDRRVRLTLLYLQLREKPEDTNLKQQFALMHLQLSSSNFYTQFIDFLSVDDPKGKSIDFEKYARHYFKSEEDFYFQYENLYDLVDKFYHLMTWKEMQSIELHQLLDVIFEFENSTGPDLFLLNKYLDRKKYKLSIQTAESEDAIRIMTIHKSKGLEFPVVVLPDLNFGPGHPSVHMLKRDEMVINTTLSKESPIKEIRVEQEEESNRTHLDQLNLLYVAFTRPVDRLYVTSLDTKSGTVIKQLKEILTTNPATKENSSGISELIIGERIKNTHEAKAQKEGFTPKNISDQLWFPDIALSKRKTTDELSLSEERRIGNQFHFVMSEINSAQEFEEKIEQWILDGSVANEYKYTLQQMVKNTFEDPAFKSIFDNATSILNEQSIIADEETSKRPDKVVLKASKTIIIDYKTGAQNKKYDKQILEYVQLFEQMKFPNVEGYLYYTEQKKLQKITL